MPTIQIIGDVHGHLDQMIEETIDSKTDLVLQVKLIVHFMLCISLVNT